MKLENYMNTKLCAKVEDGGCRERKPFSQFYFTTKLLKSGERGKPSYFRLCKKCAIRKQTRDTLERKQSIEDAQEEGRARKSVAVVCNGPVGVERLFFCKLKPCVL